MPFDAFNQMGPTSNWAALKQRSSFMPWSSEDYEIEANKLRQQKLDATAKAEAAKVRDDVVGYAAQQKALQSIGAQEAALQARGNKEASSLAAENELAWSLTKPSPGPGDEPRRRYMSWLGQRQDVNNIRNVLAGKPRQALPSVPSAPGYLIDEEAMAKAKAARSAGGQGSGQQMMTPEEAKMAGYSSPYAALQNMQLDEMHAAGMNPAIAREMQLARLKQQQAAADTAEGQSPWGKEMAINADRGDLMSGRTAIFERERANLDNELAREKEVSQAGTFFSPDVAAKRMLTTDALVSANTARYVAPQIAKNIGGRDVATINAASNMTRAQINGYVQMFNKMLDAEARTASATGITQQERDRATDAYNSIRELIRQFQSARAVDEQ